MESGHNDIDDFDVQFAALTGFSPLCWQKRLFNEHFITGDLPPAIDVPTGLGKTSVIAIWLIARARKANVPRRLVYVVDRRAVVDQATTEAVKLRDALAGEAEHFAALDETTKVAAKKIGAALNNQLGIDTKHRLPISTLRGALVDNRKWLDDPSAPTIIIGTVDMIGSRLLFEGYGVSRKMRPFQAGLLGLDTLLVLDESHLVPPFAHLLRAIEQDPTLGPREEADRKLLPRFVFLPLSATQRDQGAGEQSRAPFRLQENDWKDDGIARKRLDAKKHLHLRPLAAKDQDKQLAAAALDLATKDGLHARVVIFCDRRDKSNDGPSANGVAEAIVNLANGDKKAGRAKVDIHQPELLVGARRVQERMTAEASLRNLHFVGAKNDLDKPAFLIATAAGEVGVDMDADHMVCDLVSWERMVQRLGRVNRRGGSDADVMVFWSAAKDAAAPTDAEKRALASKAVIEKLPKTGEFSDASPGALLRLTESAQTDDALTTLIREATTAEPLHPALNRALVDAWSMTSLEKHAGRPEVAPWLRGWVDEMPQTAIVWRTCLPVCEDVSGWPRTAAEKKEILDFFEAAPLHESEKLETETFRVVSWLEERAKALLKRERRLLDETAATSAGEAEGTVEQALTHSRRWEQDDVIALILTPDNGYSGRLTLGELTQERKNKARQLQDDLAGKIVVVDARLGGLKEGLLDPACNDLPDTADASSKGWSEDAGFRVKRSPSESESEEWRFEDRFVLRRDGEGAAVAWLAVEHFKSAAQNEDSRAISRPQQLYLHQDWARSRMRSIADAVGLPEVAASALAIGAALHDEGKKAPRWQRAFNAPRDAKKFGLAGALAKTRGPIDQAMLGGYRHEFGSLPYLEADAEFNALPEEWRDLAMHLVAAHHGRARPLIETRGCDDGPPSVLEDRARAVALRFARLQKRWGPWGLAWLEALMRTADQQASRDNDERQASQARQTRESA